MEADVPEMNGENSFTPTTYPKDGAVKTEERARTEEVPFILKGVYKMIAIEEQQIRTKISSRTTTLLQQVFALQD